VNIIADFGTCRDANKAIDRRVVPDRHEMRPLDLRKIADDYIISVKFCGSRCQSKSRTGGQGGRLPFGPSQPLLGERRGAPAISQ